MPKLLIVEDEPEMVLALRDNCEFEGYEVAVASDGEEGLRKALELRPDLILLDVMLPKRSGLDVCRALRSRGVTAPVILLTARGQEPDRVAGLDLGADDYVTKPFSVRELMARIRAHLRRSAAAASGDAGQCEFGGVAVDFRAHRATRDGVPVELTPKEFEILRYFARNRGKVVTREQLMEEVWRVQGYALSRTVDNHIAKLRQKLERDPAEPEFLVTVHRVGYKLVG